MENFTLTVPHDFDFNSLNLRCDPVTDELTVNTVPLIEILKLSGIDTDREFTEDQINEILAILYQFHLSQKKDPIQWIEKRLSEVDIKPGLKYSIC